MVHISSEEVSSKYFRLLGDGVGSKVVAFKTFGFCRLGARTIPKAEAVDRIDGDES